MAKCVCGETYDPKKIAHYCPKSTPGLEISDSTLRAWSKGGRDQKGGKR